MLKGLTLHIRHSVAQKTIHNWSKNADNFQTLILTQIWIRNKQYSRKLSFSKQKRQRTRFRENCDVHYSEKHAALNNVYSSMTLTKSFFEIDSKCQVTLNSILLSLNSYFIFSKPDIIRRTYFSAGDHSTHILSNLQL